jgi:hypothetical protein
MLFVGADGPRADHPEDGTRCERAREAATRVDWDCEVHTLFQEENLGCKQAVSSAITWFFEHVETGIILEDDCVPHPTFFPFCAELLDRYKQDERIMTISGNNFQPSTRAYKSSYYFSAYMHCWGWATWRRAWKHYDGEIPSWEKLRNTIWLKRWLGGEEERKYWTDIFDRVHQGKIDSWAYPFTFACWREHGLNVVPSLNLVSNVGFGEGGVHTHNPDNDAANMPTEKISFPLEHPNYVTRNYNADQFTSKNHFLPNWKGRLLSKMPEDLANAVRAVWKWVNA